MAAAARFEHPIRTVEAVVRRVPIDVPVRTSFGTMRDRPALFLRVTDADGAKGYGEVWCNFPSVGAEHRQRLAKDVVGPVLTGMPPTGSGAVYTALMTRLHILAIQSGEWGPLRQVSAGLDAAVHDLAARRAGLPLYAFLNGGARADIRAYASGIGPEDPAGVAARFAAAGHRVFKVKVGFGSAVDHASLAAFRKAMGNAVELAVDANQGWTLDAALDGMAALAPFGLRWIEEPLAADRPLAEWQRLRSGSAVDIAAGENVDSRDGLDAMMASGTVRYIQPDVAKWGGVSECLAVGRAAQDSGHVYCPHFLGSGVGLLASAHLLAAQGGDGLLEMDTNPNPLRDALVGSLLDVKEGRIRLSDAPGIGITPDHLFD